MPATYKVHLILFPLVCVPLPQEEMPFFTDQQLLWWGPEQTPPSPRPVPGLPLPNSPQPLALPFNAKYFLLPQREETLKWRTGSLPTSFLPVLTLVLRTHHFSHTRLTLDPQALLILMIKYLSLLQLSSFSVSCVTNRSSSNVWLNLKVFLGHGISETSSRRSTLETEQRQSRWQ